VPKVQRKEKITDISYKNAFLISQSGRHFYFPTANHKKGTHRHDNEKHKQNKSILTTKKT
jgi:hypothetical protein